MVEKWHGKRMAAAAAAGATALILSGCGGASGANTAATSSTPVPSSSSSVAVPTTTQAPVTTSAPAPTTALPPPPPPEPSPEPAPQTTYAALDGAHYFSSPDGRFHCGIVTLASRTEAGCQGTTTPVPPRPEDCMISWGNGIRVTNVGAAEFMCAGGAVYTSGGESIDPALSAGQQIDADGYTCASAADGITCTNNDTGHGFRIAADSNEVF